MITKLLIAALVVLYIGAAATLFFFQRALLFASDKTSVPPVDIGLTETEIVRLKASDGVQTFSWLTRRGGDRLAIYFHGNGGSLAWRGETIQELTRQGFSVLSVEYRGYGASEGSPSEEGFARDADAAYEFARTLGYRPFRIVLYGESLGTGVAVALAARRDIGALILDAPFTSITDVAAARYWMFPVRWLIRDPFRSDLLIARINVPMLMLHGTEDRIVPIRFGRRLFSFAGPNATFVEIEGAAHIVLVEPEAQQRLRDWLARQVFSRKDEP